MIELVIKKHLESELTVPVYSEYPNKAQAGSFVLFERTGADEKNGLAKGTFAFQSYADSLYRALELDEKVQEVLESLDRRPEIGSCRLNSSYNFTDTQTKKYRFQSVYDISYYKE